MNRLQFLQRLGAAALIPLSTRVSAQAWPSRPIRFVVPFPPGGNDVFVRTLEPGMAEQLRQPLVFDYKTGASGLIGLSEVVRSAPDGYTIGMGSPGGLVALPHLQKVPYTVENDFTFVARLARTPVVLVTNNASGINSIRDLFNAARAERGRLNYAHPGNGSMTHLAAELFMRESHLQMTPVPFKGTPPAVQALMGNHVPVMAGDLSSLWPQISQGQIKPLAVTTAQRSPVLPNVPAMTELGFPGAIFAAEYGVIAPAGLPAPVLARLSSAWLRAVDSPAVRETYQKIGAEVAPLGAREYRDSMLAGHAKWGAFIRENKITTD